MENSWHDSGPQLLDVESFVQNLWKRQSEKTNATIQSTRQTPFPQTPPSSWVENPPWESDDIQSLLAEIGLYRSMPAAGMIGEPTATIHTGDGQTPSFEDLLF